MVSESNAADVSGLVQWFPTTFLEPPTLYNLLVSLRSVGGWLGTTDLVLEFDFSLIINTLTKLNNDSNS